MWDAGKDRLSSAPFRRFFETAVDLLCIADVDGYIRVVNPAWEHALGWSQQELCNRRYIELVHPDDVEITKDAATRLERGEAVERFVNRYRTKNAGWRTLEWCAASPDTDGLIFATVRDITDERRAAAQLAAVEKVAGIGTWELDTETGKAYCSPRVYEIYGTPQEEAQLLDKALTFFPDHARHTLATALQRLSSEGEPYDLTLDFNTADGRRRKVRATSAAEMRNGRIVRLYGTFEDVTDLMQTEQRLADIIRGTNAGTWEWNVQTGYMAFNDRWAEIIGYRADELTPEIETWHARVHPDDLADAYTLLDEHFAGRTDQYGCEIRMRHRAGHWVWVMTLGRVATWTADGQPEIISGTHIDISERKAQEAALKEAQADAEAANLAKSSFLANMSHEIRTPLNGVIGMAELLDARLTQPENRKMLGVIRDSGELLLGIINDILDLSKIEAGRIELEARSFRPADIAKRIEAAYALKADQKGLAFSVQVSRCAMDPRLGDEGRLMQIAHNLLSNALKFTDRGSITVDVDCSGSNAITLRVSDTGIGMTPEQVALVFEEFVQGDSSTTRRFGGSGLGMAIVRKLVDLMRGHIDIQSEPGCGTTVTVVLHFEQETDPATAIPAEVARDEISLAGNRVLSVDDNEINRMVLAAMLDRLDIEKTMVDCGEAAIEACTHEQYDLLLIDISMPGIDGIETLHRIRALPPTAPARHTPAVAVTANALAHQVEAYLDAGFEAHIGKPIELDRLRETLVSVAAQRLKVPRPPH